MVKKVDAEIKALLLEQWELLTKSLGDLQKSYHKCSGFYLIGQFSFEEEALDSLSSKYSRVSDLLLRSVCKPYGFCYANLFCPQKTFISDVKNLALCIRQMI